MNIVSFGWPWPAYGNPMRGGGFQGLDRGIWYFNHLVFEEKMMTIFSMLFGAGLVLMDQRAEARGAKIRRVYYRRVLWLLGDWPGSCVPHLDRRHPGALCRMRAVALSLPESASQDADPAGNCLLACCWYRSTSVSRRWPTTCRQRRSASKRRSSRPKADAQDEQLARELEQGLQQVHRSDARARREGMEPRARGVSWRLSRDREVPASTRSCSCRRLGFFLFGMGFMAIGRMLIGMGLMKLGVFSAERSRRFYLWMVVLGYGIGMPLMVFDAVELIRHSFSTRIRVARREILQLIWQRRRGPGARRLADAHRARAAPSAGLRGGWQPWDGWRFPIT